MRMTAALVTAALTSGLAPAPAAAESPDLAASVAKLPDAPPAFAGDWLVDEVPTKAVVCRGAHPLEVALDNGLARRAFRLAPNAATVSFRNRVTGEELLRSVRPEARLRIDGVDVPVGGLEGQRIHNYLKPEWLDGMAANPAAGRLRSFRAGATEARFPWKKRMEWMPQDLPWPPPGASLTLSFDLPATPAGGPEPPRPILLADDFSKPDPAWKPVLSKAEPRTSFRNEGKPGEILAKENTHAFAERPLPPAARRVECVLDAGTDRSATWGPGLAVVFPDRVVKVNLRPGKRQFGVHAGEGEQFGGAAPEDAACTLRISWDGASVHCEATADGTTWATRARAAVAGQPTAVRVGKMDGGGGASDFNGDAGALARCHVTALRVLGAPQAPPASAPAAVTVDVHYELYDGLPLFCKWITVRNASDRPVRIEKAVSEILAAAEPESAVEANIRWEQPNLHVETDYAFLAFNAKSATHASIRWLPDPLYATQVHYERQTPCLLECGPEFGPDVELAPGATFTSLRTFELLLDGADRERRGLSQRRMYRAVAPWVTENPVLLHLLSNNPEAIRKAVDQCATVGFEMIVLSFGSGFDFESRDAGYQEAIRQVAEYARSKNVALGGYSLLASRGAATPADNCQPGRVRFGVMPCLGAAWGRAYLDQLRAFIAKAGLGVLEHDGSYPGDTCASTKHPGHRGLADSQWVQWSAITDFYKWCRANGVYLNVPDWYFLAGSSKTGMGYRETNWSLPRDEQVIIERQNIYDGTWEKTPSMGWMFVPLTQYHGGGAAATIEPLDQHRDHYEARLADLFGAGVQACWRGPRIYDTDATRDLVKRWVDFYKAHRPILDSDIVHLRRPDGRDWDGILHVNPRLPERALAMLYNPLGAEIERRIFLPVRYAGLAGQARVRRADGRTETLPVAADRTVSVNVRIPPRGHAWLVLEAAAPQ